MLLLRVTAHTCSHHKQRDVHDPHTLSGLLAVSLHAHESPQTWHHTPDDANSIKSCAQTNLSHIRCMHHQYKNGSSASKLFIRRDHFSTMNSGTVILLLFCCAGAPKGMEYIVVREGATLANYKLFSFVSRFSGNHQSEGD